MIGNLYIDGKDVHTEYGIFIAEGGYQGIMEFPPLKKVDTNNWQEEDGIEADLSAPALDTRDFPMKFGSHARARTGHFIELLSDGGYHTFDFRTIERVYRLRMVSQSNLDTLRGLETFTLQFANDFPLSKEYIYTAPQSEFSAVTGYELDGVDFSNYGVRILEGSLDEVLKSPAVKKNLLSNVGGQHGATYAGQHVTFQAKDVKLNCLMRANTMEEFWRNYDALIFDLSKPEERLLFVDTTSYEYPCYYKSSSVSEFFPIGKIWFEFSLTVVFTSFRVMADEYLLASERGEWIMTEDGECEIDLGEIQL